VDNGYRDAQRACNRGRWSRINQRVINHQAFLVQPEIDCNLVSDEQ